VCTFFSVSGSHPRGRHPIALTHDSFFPITLGFFDQRLIALHTRLSEAPPLPPCLTCRTLRLFLFFFLNYVGAALLPFFLLARGFRDLFFFFFLS